MKDSYPVIIRILSQRYIFCRRCGATLTSERTRKKGIGQRCWREERGLPPLQWKPKSAIDAVPYVYSGNESYQQMKLGDFD